MCKVHKYNAMHGPKSINISPTEPDEALTGRGGFYEYPLDCICEKKKGTHTMANGFVQ